MPAGPPKTGGSWWEVWQNVVYSQLNTKRFQNNQENTYSWTSWFIPHCNRESAHFEVCGWFKNTVDFPGGSDSKESTCNAGDQDSIPWSEKNPGDGNGYPLQHYCLENPLDRGTWWGNSPWSHKEADMTERLSISTRRYCRGFLVLSHVGMRQVTSGYVREGSGSKASFQTGCY